MGWNYIYIYIFLKLQPCSCWSLWMNTQFHHTLHRACDYLPMLGLNLTHVSKRGPRYNRNNLFITFWFLSQISVNNNRMDSVFKFVMKLNRSFILRTRHHVCSLQWKLFSPKYSQLYWSLGIYNSSNFFFVWELKPYHHEAYMLEMKLVSILWSVYILNGRSMKQIIPIVSNIINGFQEPIFPIELVVKNYIAAN